MLLRFDPFRDADRLTEQALSVLRSRNQAMALDAYRHGDELVLQVDLPGVDPASIDLTVEKNVLTVSAERRSTIPDGDEAVVAERPTGRLSRQLFLGDGLDVGRVTAHYQDGVLTVTVPVAEQAKPRRVEVTTASGRAAVLDARSEPAGAPSAAGTAA